MDCVISASLAADGTGSLPIMAFTLDPPKAAGEIGRLLISHDLVFENLLQNLPKDRTRPLLPRVVVDMKNVPRSQISCLSTTPSAVICRRKWTSSSLTK
jgi:hypothetical protein